MQILRHSKIAVTMEIYTEILSAATREALKKPEYGFVRRSSLPSGRIVTRLVTRREGVFMLPPCLECSY
jgi:hypothetical protein